MPYPPCPFMNEATFPQAPYISKCFQQRWHAVKYYNSFNILHSEVKIKIVLQHTVMFLSFRTDGLWANSVDPDQTAPRGSV